MAWRSKIALGLALALVATRAALPSIAAHLLEEGVRDALGRAVEVGNVDLSLLAGRVIVEGLLVGPALDPEAASAEIDPRTALVRWPHLLVDVGWLALLSGELRVQRIELRGGRDRLVLLEDDRLEPLVVKRPEESEPPRAAPDSAGLTGAGEGPAADEPGEEEGGWPLRVEQLALEDHAIHLIDAADASRPPIEFTLEELTVGGVVLSDGHVSVGPVGLRSPRIRVRRDLQFAAAAAPETAEPVAPAPPEASEAVTTRLGFRLASFAIEDAQLALLLEESEFEVGLDLSVQDATLERGVRFPVELRLTREDGWLEVNGDLGLVPVGFAGTIRWEDLSLAGLIAAAAPQIPLNLHAGSLTGDLEVDLGAAGGAEPPRLSVRGQLKASQIGLRHDEELLKLGCEAFELVADEIEIPLGSGEPARIAVASVRIGKPALKLVRRAPDAGGEGGEPAPRESGRTSEAPRIAVGELELSGGSLQLIDESVEPTVTVALRGIRLAGSGLQMPARSGRLEAELRSIEGASLQIAGDWREGSGATTVAVDQLQLPSYRGYLARAAGFEFTRGSLSLEGRIRSAGPRHEVEADLTFARPALRDVEEGAFAQAFGMSAPTAVSLLTGPRGNIVLPLDLTVDEAGSEVDLRTLLLGAFRQSLAAVIAAPLKGLGLALRVGTAGLAGGGAAPDLDPIQLEPGSAELTPDQIEHARLVAEGFSARPAMGLVLAGRSGSEDEPYLRARALLERIEAGDFAPYHERGFRERRRLRAGLQRRVKLEPDELGPEDAALIQRWLEEIDVSREARESLARARAEAVRAVLVDAQGLEPERVRIGKPRRGSPGVAIELFVTDPGRVTRGRSAN